MRSAGMPLKKSSSKEAFGQNVGAELAAGKPKKQALAIAFDTQRRARAQGKKRGGVVGKK